MLALPPLDGSLTEPIVFSGCLMGEKYVDQAGEPFHIYSLKKLGLMERTDPEDDDVNGSDDDGSGTGEPKFDKEKMKNKRKKSTNLDGLVSRSHYEVLGIAHLGFTATEKDVRKAHRAKTLLHHPDKMTKEEYTEQNKAIWLEVTLFLSDPKDPRGLRVSNGP